MADNQFAAKPYPSGYHFSPTDDELIVEYLLKKINDQPLPADDIFHVVNFYDHHPDSLSGEYAPIEDNEWYFFTIRSRKYPKGSKVNRAAGNYGYWRTFGADKRIYSNGQIVGSKVSLSFYEGKYSKGIKTSWKMLEYVADQPLQDKKDGMKLDDWVICRLSKSDEGSSKNPRVKKNQEKGDDKTNGNKKKKHKGSSCFFKGSS